MGTVLERFERVAAQRKDITYRARQEAEELYVRRVEEARAAWERSIYPLVLQAVAEGHTRAEIGRAYGSSNYYTIRDLIARAEEWAAAGGPTFTPTPTATVTPSTTDAPTPARATAEAAGTPGVPSPKPDHTPGPQENEAPQKIEFYYGSDGEPYAQYRGIEFRLEGPKKMPAGDCYILKRYVGQDLEEHAERMHKFIADYPKAHEKITWWDGTVGSVTVE